MDEARLRAARQAARRSESAPNSGGSKAPEASTRPTSPARHHAPSKKDTSKWRLPMIVIAAVVAVVVLVGGWFAWQGMQAPSMVINSSKYQAVSIVDGQIYFGKLSVVNDDYVKLTNAYYLQAQPPKDTTETDDEAPAAEQNDVKLIKLANKIYGPENEIVIAKSQIVSYENLKSDGQVAKWLKENAE